MALYTPEAAIVQWHGPLPLDEVVLSDPAIEVPIKGEGLYIIVGKREYLRGTPLRFFGAKRILYIGQTTQVGGFLSRLRQHKQASRGKNAKVREIEGKRFEIECVLLGHLQDPMSVPRITDTQTVLDVAEGLFIWLFDPSENDPKASTPRVPPTERLLVLNRFRREFLGSKIVRSPIGSNVPWPKWRPTTIPDLMEFEPSPHRAELSWVGMRRGMMRRLRVTARGGAVPLRPWL